jgi:hypothetical protein
MIEQHPSSDILHQGRIALISLIAVTNTMLENEALFTSGSFGDSEEKREKLAEKFLERITENTAEINDSLRFLGGLVCSLDINDGRGETQYTLHQWHGNEDGLMKWSVAELPSDAVVHLGPNKLISELRALHS